MPLDCNGAKLKKSDYVIELDDPSRMFVVTYIPRFAGDDVIVIKHHMTEAAIFSKLVRKLSKEEIVLRKLENV